MNKTQKILLTITSTFSLISILVFGLILSGVDLQILNRAVITSKEYQHFKELRQIISYRIQIENKYYVETDADEIAKGAIRGMFSSLPDGYSRYYTKEEIEAKKLRDNGESVGIGIRLERTKNKEFVIIEVIEGRPAEAAGLKVGDRIVSVNDIELTDESYQEVLSSLREDSKEYAFFGKYTKAKIVVEREEKMLEFEVDRDVQIESSVESEVMDDIGYVKIKFFIHTTYDDYIQAIRDFDKQGIKKLIIDLRNNPGGLVNEASKIAGSIVGKQIIYFTNSREEEMKEHLSSVDKESDFEIVVLVDEYSASSSEILVGAIKDYEAAKIVGTTTFGKGIIQTTYTNFTGDGYQITTSEYLTPKKNKIHKIGIKPDYEADTDKELDYAKELLKKNAGK